MHSLFLFLIPTTPSEVELDEIDNNDVKKYWMVKRAMSMVRDMGATANENGNNIASTNFNDFLAGIKSSLEAEWKTLSEDEIEVLRQETFGFYSAQEMAEGVVETFVDEYANSYCDENNWYQEEIVVFPDGEVIQVCPGGDWRGRDRTYFDFLNIDKDKRWDSALKLAARCVVSDISDINYEDKDPEFDVMFGDMDIKTANEIISLLGLYFPRLVAKQLFKYLIHLLTSNKVNVNGDHLFEVFNSVNNGNQINIEELDLILQEMVIPDFDASPTIVGDIANDSTFDTVDDEVVINDSGEIIYTGNSKNDGDDTNKDHSENSGFYNEWSRDYRFKKTIDMWFNWKRMNFRPFSYDTTDPYKGYRAFDLRDKKDSDPKNSAILIVDIHT